MPEYGPDPERKKQEAIEFLRAQAKDLGFVETDELRDLQAECLRKPEKFGECLTRWRTAAEEQVNNQTDPRDYQKAQLGLLLTQAVIVYEAFGEGVFYDEIFENLQYAQQLGLKDLVEWMENLMF